jgi:hypothetical protein
MADIYCVYEAIYDHDGYTNFSHIGTYNDYDKCIEDLVELSETVHEFTPCHEAMSENNYHIYKGFRTDCQTSCPETCNVPYHGGFIIETITADKINTIIQR